MTKIVPGLAIVATGDDGGVSPQALQSILRPRAAGAVVEHKAERGDIVPEHAVADIYDHVPMQKRNAVMGRQGAPHETDPAASAVQAVPSQNSRACWL